MTLLPPCPTEKAILLCATPDAGGVLRFPSIRFDGGSRRLPGIVFAPERLVPINPQLLAAAQRVFGRDVSLDLQVEQAYGDQMVTAAGEEATLYVATFRLGTNIVAEKTWQSMPDILRSEKGRGRIPFLRAWQVLSGGLHLTTKAVDAEDVAKYFDD